MTVMIRTFTTAAFLAASGVASAQTTLPAPTDAVVLTISGNIEVTNAGSDTAFDRSMLADLPRTEFATTTIWTEGRKTFSGVSLKTLLDEIGASGRAVKATAVNDYSVEIPIDSLSIYPVVADLMDGAPMSLRDKGPLWIVFPFDSGEEFQTEVIYSQSIWQLDRLEVLP